MQTYILILTLMMGTGTEATGGGVTTVEIDGIGMCGLTGREWVERTGTTRSFYTCVKKPHVF